MSKKKTQALVPKLCFPEFRGKKEWEVKAIGRALVELSRSIVMEDDQSYSLVTVKRRYGGVVSRGIFKGAEIKVKSQFLLKENDFLISKRQIVHNACGLVPKDLDGSIVSNEYSVLAARKNYDILFLKYFAQQPIISQSFLNCSIGIHIEKMLFKLNDWLKQEFSFPSFAEQQKIADCLSSIDGLITTEFQKLDALKAHKKGLIQKLFPAEGKTAPKLRFSEFQGNGVWEEKKLDKVGEIITGKTPSTSDESLWNGNIQFVTPTDITEEKYQLNTQRTVVYNAKMKVLPKHSIMFTCIASIGKISLSVFPCITNQQINSIIPFEEFENEFIYYSLLNISYLINSKLANTTLPIINKTEFSQFLISIPSKKEQKKIANCLSSLDELITAQAQKVEGLKAHKKGLMQQLFPSASEVGA